MSANIPSLEFTLERVRKVRALLLRLHKALLESERVVYEQFYGPIKSKGEYFQLVLEHEWFSWLRLISKLIVQIDETLSAKEPVTLDRATQILEDTRSLLQPSSEGTALEQRYYHAIQRDPDIALMNAELSNLLNNDAK